MFGQPVVRVPRVVRSDGRIIRIVVASVDTFLQFADATQRLDLYGGEKRGRTLPKTAQMIIGESAEGAGQERLSHDRPRLVGAAAVVERWKSAPRRGAA